MKGMRAHINPELLIWARERINADPEYLARRAGTKLHIYQSWEGGEVRPTHKQLQKVAKVLGRSPSFFYLQNPPEEPEPRMEMRRVYGSSPMADSTAFAQEIQEMLRRRNMVLDLYDRLDEAKPEIPFSFTIDQDPEELAQTVRTWLNVTIDEQFGWDSVYKALKSWRSALEQRGMLTFQMSGIDMDEARGFAINYRPLPIVSFNSNDSVTGRIFTLMHEAGHLLLGESVLHERAPYESDQQVEQWCNLFSASVLIPGEHVITTAQAMSKGEQAVWNEKEVKSISRHFVVSPAAMVRRLKRLNLIESSNYEFLRSIFDAFRPREGDGGGGNHYNNMLARLGTLLPSLAFQGYYSGEITTRDLSSIMGTRVVHLDEMEKKVMGANYAFK